MYYIEKISDPQVHRHALFVIQAACFDGDGQFVKACYFSDLKPFKNGALLHNGDQRDGNDEGDDETITVDCDALPNIKTAAGTGVVYVFFCVNSYSGSNFRTVKSAGCTLRSLSTGEELHHCTMSLEDRRATAMIVGRLRDGGDGKWYFKDFAVSAKEACFANLCPTMQQLIKEVNPNGKSLLLLPSSVSHLRADDWAISVADQLTHRIS